MKKVQINYKNKDERFMVNLFVSLIFNLIWGTIKLIMCLVLKSRFIFASAMFTYSLSIAKLLSFLGIFKFKKENKILQDVTSILIISSGIFYLYYNLRLLYDYNPVRYSLVSAITIALFSFVFMTKSILELFKKQPNRYFKNIRIISLIFALNDMLLTQMALINANDKIINIKYNMLFAVFISSLCIILGLISLIKGRKEINNIDENIE